MLEGRQTEYKRQKSKNYGNLTVIREIALQCQKDFSLSTQSDAFEIQELNEA